MNKFLSVCCIVIVFLSIYFLQANFFNWFNIAGIKPNLFIIFLIFIGLFLGKEHGFFFGITFGLLLDMFSASIIGLNAIMLGVVGLTAGLLEKNFSIEHKFTFLFITILLTFFGETIKYLLILLISNNEIDLINFIRILVIEIIYNILVILIIYPLMGKAGKKLKKILVEDKKQIKYF